MSRRDGGCGIATYPGRTGRLGTCCSRAILPAPDARSAADFAADRPPSVVTHPGCHAGRDHHVIAVARVTGKHGVHLGGGSVVNASSVAAVSGEGHNRVSRHGV